MEAAWNAFGSDSDSSDSEEEYDTARREEATRLMQQYNTQSSAGEKQVSNSEDSISLSYQPSYADQKLRTASLPWPNTPPLYLGPADVEQLMLGGGRGFCATEDIPPGTCILIEEPTVKGWSEQQMGKRLGLESIHHIFEKDNAQAIVYCMEELHPTKFKVDTVYRNSSEEIAALDKIQIVDMIASADSDKSHTQQVQSLVTYANDRNIVNSDGTQLNSRDINRLLLTLRYNGFDSGLYLHFSIFNHDEDPNCIKFRPSSDGEQQRHYSEARTTRVVKKGEALTLHYLENPREVSHATRRKILWDQHRFDIGNEEAFRKFLRLTEDANGRKSAVYESELVDGKFPDSDRSGTMKSSSDDQPAACNVENSLDDLEEIVVELQAIFQSKPEEGNSMSSTSFERAAALELTAWELITATKSSLGNNNHILLSRCRRLHLDSIEILLEHCSSALDNKASTELTARFVPSALELLESQKLRLGNDHTDVARTNNDLSMGIQALLSHSPKHLLSLGLEGLRSLDQCSRFEYNCRKEKERIEKLFPKDADDIISLAKDSK